MLSCAPSSPSGFADSILNSQPGLVPFNLNMESFMADVDGDGRSDFCRFVGSAPNIVLSCLLATANGFGSNEISGQPGMDLGWDSSFFGTSRFMADVDGDGRADFCRFVGSAPNVVLSCILATPAGFGPKEFTARPGVVMDLGHGAVTFGPLPRFMADVDGDGRADFCRFVGDLSSPSSLTLSCALSTPAGFGNIDVSSQPGLVPFKLSMQSFMVDANGDGRADFCRFLGNPLLGSTDAVLSCAFSTITYDQKIPTTASISLGPDELAGSPGVDVGWDSSFFPMSRFMADVDGDGRADFCRFIGNTPNVSLSCLLNTSGGFGSKEYTAQPGIQMDLGKNFTSFGSLPRFMVKSK
jgi:hypothetical protein